MYACVCAQITDAQWEQALREAGNDWQRASVATGAGLVCGGCRVYLAQPTAPLGLAVLPGPVGPLR